MQIFITFGTKYAQEPHPRLPFAHPDGYLTIEAPDYDTALRTAFALTGGAHGTDYSERPSDITYQRGELARVIVHDAIATDFDSRWPDQVRAEQWAKQHHDKQVRS